MNKKDVSNSDKSKPTETWTEWVEKITKLAQEGVRKEREHLSYANREL